MRIVIWATPMLGFLGTVVGITDALGDLGRELGSAGAADAGNSLNTAMQGLLAGLYVAFDTTAIALCFSIVLMFIQFMLDRAETQMLEAVDERASAELAGRFELVGTTTRSERAGDAADEPGRDQGHRAARAAAGRAVAAVDRGRPRPVAASHAANDRANADGPGRGP